MGMDLNPITGIVGAVGQIVDDVWTSDEERLKADLQAMQIGLEAAKVDADLIKGQQDINREEAKHASIFVAGWRPSLGWCGVAAIAYQYVLYPLLTWAWAWMQAQRWVPDGMKPPPLLDIEALMVLMTGILGLASARTFEKVRGVGRVNTKE